VDGQLFGTDIFVRKDITPSVCAQEDYIHYALIKQEDYQFYFIFVLVIDVFNDSREYSGEYITFMASKLTETSH
jgi:hypothetical protein